MSQDVRQRIAKNVKFYREQNRLKKEELALILGFDNSYISKLENCNINITIDKLSMIATVLKVDIINLLKKIP